MENYVKFMDGDKTHEYVEEIKHIISDFLTDRTKTLDGFDVENLSRLIQREIGIQKYRVIEIEKNERYDVYFYHDGARFFILMGLSNQNIDIELNTCYITFNPEQIDSMLDELQERIKAQQVFNHIFHGE